MRVQTRDLAAREEKLEALQQKFTESVGALVTGDDWKRALEFAAKFRARSFGNTMLIAVQHYAAFQQGRVPEPMPTYVAGFRQWLSLNRAVMKGQSGYAILAPVTARFASSNLPTQPRGDASPAARSPASAKPSGPSLSDSSPHTSGTAYLEYPPQASR
ncbi:MAG: ArdC-like ssDNA-binding domain-containing protein [Nocardioides sp.]